MSSMRLVYILLLFFAFSCTQQEKKSKWKLVWSEDFDGNSLDSSKWSRIPRKKHDWSNYMSSSDSCYELREGKLLLKGIINTFEISDTARFLTGGVYTKRKQNFTYGKMAVRAKLHAAKGAWPAFWMLPEKRGAWPDGGEIDIMERLSYDSIIYQTVHTLYTVRLGITDTPPHTKTSPFCTDKFNTYSIEIHPDSLVFAINDSTTFSYPKIETDKEQQYPFGRPYYLLLDMQLGGSWVGSVAEKDLPTYMEIDWVRFYELNK